MTMALDKAKQCRVATCLDDVTTTAMTTTMTTKAAVAAAATTTTLAARTNSNELSSESDGDGDGVAEGKCKSVNPLQKLAIVDASLSYILLLIIWVYLEQCCLFHSSPAFHIPLLPSLHFLSFTSCSFFPYAALPHAMLLFYSPALANPAQKLAKKYSSWSSILFLP